MKPGIDPKVDCVFEAILGSEEHKALLVHFLNAVLTADSGVRIREVELLNPYNEREFETDKLSVVDVKARDAAGRSYQIEIQLALHPGLSARMLYTWSTIYHGVIGKGQDFTALRPVVAIWLLNESLFPERQASHLSFAVLNREHGIVLSDHLQIHLLQLPDWQLREGGYQELDRWMFLFKEGENLDAEHLPAILQTEEMTEAMHVLRHFSENERDYLLYQNRLETERVAQTWKRQIEQLQMSVEQERQAKEQATRQAERERQEKERERQEKERATQQAERERQEKERATQQAEQERQEKERLLRLLQQAGIDPQQAVARREE